MRLSGKWKIASCIVFLLCPVMAVILWKGNSLRQTLPDGTVIVLSRLKVARTHEFYWGTPMASVLGPWLPANGIELGPISFDSPKSEGFQAPEGSETLAAQLWFQLKSPGNSPFARAPFFSNYRFIVRGQNGFGFVHEFPYVPNDPAGSFHFINFQCFPRDSPFLHLALEERDDSEDLHWREMAVFSVKNPKIARIEPWKPEPKKRLKLCDDLEVEIGDLIVHHGLLHRRGIGESSSRLTVRITQKGLAVTNWTIPRGELRDSSGNFDYVRFQKNTTNDWIVLSTGQPLDPAKVWRFRVNFAMDSDFPAANLYSFSLPASMKGTVNTNLGGFPFLIHFGYSWDLVVHLLSKPEDKAVTFVSAADEEGNRGHEFAAKSQHHFGANFRDLGASGQVRVVFAIQPNYPAEFFLQPRLEKAAPSKDDQ